MSNPVIGLQIWAEAEVQKADTTTSTTDISEGTQP